MSDYLSRFKKEADPKKDRRTSLSLPSEIYDQFIEHIGKYKLTFNEAVLLLIKKELGILDDASDMVAVTSEYLFRNTKQTSSSYSDVPSGNIPVRKTTYKSSTGRFTTTPWQVNGRLPCPICETWQSSANFARHAKAHGMTTQEIFTQYKDKADEMVRKINE